MKKYGKPWIRGRERVYQKMAQKIRHGPCGPCPVEVVVSLVTFHYDVACHSALIHKQ